ncbi:MAG: hypothetical protein AMK73_09980, partial [Planctomycetes bacterium SM23_32]
HLPGEDKARYDLSRQLVQQTTEELPALDRRTKVDRAEEQLAAGIAACEAGDYLAASRYLKASAGFDVGMGWLDNRALRRTRAKVEGTLDELRAAFENGKQLYAQGQLEQARAALATVKDSPFSIGAQEVQEAEKLVAAVDHEMAQQKLAAMEARRQAAADLLAGAKANMDAQNYQAASADLTELVEMTDYLSQEQAGLFQGLCAALREATGTDPTMTAEEKVAEAERLYEQGMQAYGDQQFADAAGLLERAARLDVDLGRRRNRRLADRLQEVQQTLAGLREDLEQAGELVQGHEYDEAIRMLRGIEASGVNIGDEQTAEVGSLLAEAERLLAEQEARQEQQRRDRAAELLVAAKELANRGDHVAASAKLNELAALEEYMTEAQRDESLALKDAIAGALEAADIEMRLKRAQELAERAEQLLAAQGAVRAMVDEADAALAKGDPKAAEESLVGAQQARKKLDLAASPTLAEMAVEVEGKLASVRAELARIAQREAAQAQLAALVADARGLAADDLLAAEQKVVEFLDFAEREGLTLAAEQAAVRDDVRQAVEARYGPGRRLRPELYVVTEKYRNLALGKLIAAQREAAEQQQTADALAGLLSQCRAEVEGGELEQALNRAEAIVQMAGEERLAGPALARVLEQTASFLDAEFEGALAAAYPGAQDVAAEALGRARLAAARLLAEFYLEVNAPELAEPYLRMIEGDPALAVWAKASLAQTEALKREADRARLAQVKGEADRVLQLAQQLHDLARDGQLAKAPAVRRELADARLTLQVTKARSALARGAYTEASRLMAEASLEGVSEDVVEDAYDPVRARLEKLKIVATKLAAAEAAFEPLDAAAVAARLREAAAVQVDSKPLGIKREALAGALDTVLDMQEGEIALRARAAGLAERIAGRLSQVQLREQAWEQYRSALAMFLADEEGAQAAAAQAVVSGGLRASEVATAREVQQALAGSAESPDAVAAQRKLADARAAYALENYARAADLLDELKGMPGCAASATMQADARKLDEQIAGKEQKARELYAQAVEAYGAQDVDRVRKLTRKLKAEYANTKTYQRHH